jgi:hypothetical protein
MRLAVSALAGILACSTVALAAPSPAFRTIALKTASPVAIVYAGGAGTAGGFRAFAVDRTCFTFRNEDARTAKHVRFRLAYYDKDGTRAGGDVFDRRGTFTTGALVEGFYGKTLRVNEENCVFMHFPSQGIAVNIVYVESVDFEDGSTWTVQGPDLPERLGTRASVSTGRSAKRASIRVSAPMIALR